jgi:hypothetical protein
MLSNTEKNKTVINVSEILIQTCQLNGIDYLSLDKKVKQTMLSIFVEGFRFAMENKEL